MSCLRAILLQRQSAIFHMLIWCFSADSNRAFIGNVYCHWIKGLSYFTYVCRDHFVNAPSQWKMMLHCKVLSHWLGASTKWSLVWWYCLIIVADGIMDSVSKLNLHYRQVSNIRRTLVSNKIVDNSDVVGASPVGAAPTTSSFST